jgi:hypothetical protein
MPQDTADDITTTSRSDKPKAEDPRNYRAGQPSKFTRPPKDDSSFERDYLRRIETTRQDLDRQRRRALQEVRLDAWSGVHFSTRKRYKPRLIARNPKRPGTSFIYLDSRRPCSARVATASGFALLPQIND